MATPPQPPAQPEYTTINGVRYKLTKCNRCTGSFEIYLINKEPDRNKPAVWEVHNKDGALHQHDKKSGGGGGWAPRPPTPKFVLRIKKTFGTTEVEMTADCTSYDDLKDKFDEALK